jgi:uncharacterized caspase-like protein
MSFNISIKRRPSYHLRYLLRGVILLLLLSSTGCQLETGANLNQALKEAGKSDPNKLLVVDCLLPAQIRKLGSQLTYLSQRRPIKTSALDCEIRGGEYVAYDRADYRTALNVWLPRAKEGDSEAQNYVGEIYEKGLGIQADYVTAAAWYKKAAEQKNSRAQINLGFLYEKGLGVEKDLSHALNLYRMASGLADDSLQFNSTIIASAETKQQVISLKQEVEQQKRESAKLKKQLKNTRTRLQTQKKSLSTAETRLTKLRKEIASRKSETVTKAGTEKLALLSVELGKQETQVNIQRKKIADLENNLKFQRNTLDKQLAAERQKSNALTADLKQQKEKVSSLNKKLQALETKQAQQSIEGPSIEIMDPPIALMRGLPSIRLRSATTERIIVGKVMAPAGLLSFTVNDNSEKIDKSGVFSVTIPVERDQVPVKMVAIDKGGKKASIEFMIIPQTRNISQHTIQTATPTPASAKILAGKVDFGTYHALIIGNNNYQHFPGLDTAINDARETEKVLREKYGFKTRLLIDATRYEILSVLNDLRDQLTENDNLVIYYAGHGELDRPNSRGHWLPVDAERENSANWISNIAITDILNAMKAKHILVVADSCYSGSMSLSSVPRLDEDPGDVATNIKLKWLKVMAKVRSRTVLTSGGLQPVLDQGEGNHSVFSNAFLSTLKNNDGVLEAYKLYRNLFTEVRQSAGKYGVDQEPEYSAIRHGGHEAGEFIFVPVI